MFRKIIILLAVSGFLFSIFMIFYGLKKPPAGPIPFAPAHSPYTNFVAGEGLVESPYKNIYIGVPFGELVDQVYVAVGDRVKKGDPLFKLDTRSLEAQLVQAKRELEVARVNFENKKTQYSFFERLKDRAAVSEQQYAVAFYDKESAQNEVAKSEAAVEVINTNIERSTIRAPIDGEVFQLNVRVGQYANLNPFDQMPLILFGDDNLYHLRIDIDEEDCWRIIPGADAQAFVRGNANITFSLKFEYVEPYIIPKRSLSGVDTERVDTRVLQLVYSFTRDSYPVYIGQLLDVYVDAQPNEAAA